MNENINVPAETIDRDAMEFEQVELTSDDFQWIQEVDLGDAPGTVRTSESMHEAGYILIGVRMNRESAGGLVLLYARNKPEGETDDAGTDND